MGSKETVATTIRIDKEMSDAIDQFRREESDLPTAPEAMRRILRDWLEQNGYITVTVEDEEDG